MSMQICTFVPEVDDAVIPAWLERLEKAGMPCEIHPDFSFADQRGFLPFKLRLTSPAHEEWADESYLTGFEFYMEDFDLAAEIDKRTEKPSGLKRFFGAKPIPVNFVSAEIDARLAGCTKVLIFVWGSADTFEMRLSRMQYIWSVRSPESLTRKELGDIRGL